MSFTDTLKRSLGFEETESSANNNSTTSAISDFIRNLTQSSNNNQQQNPSQQYRPRDNPTQQPVENSNVPPRPTPIIYEDGDYVITPEQPFYEIVLLRPKTLDDINYIVDQVIEEKNPVILDLSFLEKESPANFRLAGEKIKQMRARYGAQALLLARSEDKNLIIVSPKKVNVVNKG